MVFSLFIVLLALELGLVLAHFDGERTWGFCTVH